MIRIALDAMGGDHAPGPEVAGAVAAVREAPVEVTLVGDEVRLRRELARVGAAVEPRIHVAHAPEAVTMDDVPARVYRQKPRSSMRVAFELVAGGRVDAVVSAGNSGAVLGHALLVLGRIPGVERPGVVAELPVPGGRLVLCDMGANVGVRATTLAQFGVLGACYAQVVHGHARPRVGLLSNGAEPSKGTALTRAADALLHATAASASTPFEYLGYVEGTEIFAGGVDVVATDGFTGNVVLKVTEGVAEVVLRLLDGALGQDALGRLGGLLLRPRLRQVKRAIDYAETGGALLAGVRGVVTLCHGRSDLTAIKNAIKLSARAVRARIVDELGSAIARHGAIWAPAPDASLARDPAAGPGKR